MGFPAWDVTEIFVEQGQDLVLVGLVVVNDRIRTGVKSVCSNDFLLVDGFYHFYNLFGRIVEIEDWGVGV